MIYAARAVSNARIISARAIRAAVLPLRFSSLLLASLSFRLSASVSVALASVSVAAAAWACVSVPAEVASLFSRLSLVCRASRFSVVRLSSGGVPVAWCRISPSPAPSPHRSSSWSPIADGSAPPPFARALRWWPRQGGSLPWSVATRTIAPPCGFPPPLSFVRRSSWLTGQLSA